MNSSRLISHLLALLLALGSIASSSASYDCLESASCAGHSLSTAWLENEEDTYDLDSFSCESNRAEFTSVRVQSDFGLHLLPNPQSFSHLPIRAPPISP